MSEEENNENFDQVDLTKIPFRVIIWGILCFREFEVKMSTDNKCSLFGYFKYDRTRKIFQVFSCIEVIEYTNEVIDFSRLLSLTLKSVHQSFLDKIISISNKFKNLESILMPGFSYVKRNNEYVLLDSNANFSYLFSKPGCFPKLENLSIGLRKNQTQTQQAQSSSIDMKNWHLNADCLRIVSQLKTFNLNLQHPKYVETLGQTNFLSNGVWKCLKKLTFSCISLPRAVILEAPPTLEHFSQTESVNFEIDLSSTSRLKYLNIRNCEIKLMKRYLMCSHNVEYLGVGSNMENSDWIFEYLSEFKKVKKLKLFQTKFSETPLNERMKLPPNVESFVVYPNNSFPPQLLESGNYSKMRELKIFRSDFKYKPLVLSYSSGIRILRIYGKNVDDSVFFSKNKWENLKILRLLINQVGRAVGSGIQSLTGANFTMMPKLKVFTIRSITFSDIFFQKNRFECLTNLKISSGMNVEGMNWNKTVTSNLRVLEIVRTKNLRVDHFFRENEFPFLESLSLREIERKMENNNRPNNKFQFWNPLSSLKNLCFHCCSGFGDEFFQTMKFENLEILTLVVRILGDTWDNGIMSNSNVNYDTTTTLCGRNWNFLPELKKFSWDLSFPKGTQIIDENDFFGEFFWSDPPFPVSEKDEKSKEKEIVVSRRGSTTMKVHFNKME